MATQRAAPPQVIENEPSGGDVEDDAVWTAEGRASDEIPIASSSPSATPAATPRDDDDGIKTLPPGAAAPSPSWLRHPALPSTLYAILAVAVGIQVSIFGPALLRLSAQVGASLGDTAYASAARTLASVGASAAGPIFDVLAAGQDGAPVRCGARRSCRLPRALHAHTVMGGAALVGGLGSALIPAARSLGALYLGLALQGAASGLLDTGSNLLMMWLWHERRAGAPWMQTLHFGFAAGATLAPLLLRATEAGDDITGSGGGGGAAAAGNNSSSNATAPATISPPAGTTYQYAFFALAALYCVCGAALSFVPAPASPWSVSNNNGTGSSSAPTAADGVVVAPSEAADASGPPAKAAAGMTRRIWGVMGLVAIMFLLYVGGEHSYGTFLTPYAIFVMGRPEAFGQYATAVYWAAMTAGRFGSIGASLWLAPATLLTLALVTCTTCAVVLAAVPAHTDASLLVLTAIFGAAMAPQYPSTLALAATFAPMRAAYTTAFSLCNSGGAWLLPFIVASFLKNVPASSAAAAEGGGVPDPHSGARAMMYVVAVACAANLGVFLLAWRRGTRLRAALSAGT